MLMNYSKPTIAMVNGWCFGGAFTPLVACDLAIAAEEAPFGVSEINWGIIPGGNVTRALAATMSLRDAMYYVMTGRTFDGRKAAQMGVVNEAVPRAKLRAHTKALATELLGKNPAVLRAGKTAVRHVQGMAWELSDEYLQAKQGNCASSMTRPAAPRGSPSSSTRRAFGPGSADTGAMTEAARPGRSAIERLLNPRSVAVVGASATPGSLAGAVLGNLDRFAFTGDVHLVNANRKEINGRPCLPSAADLPQGVDCAVLAIPRAGILDAVKACAARGVGAIIIFAAGFAEAGADGRALQDEIARIARDHGIAVEGPNCLGFINNVDRIALTFGTTAPEPLDARRKIGIVSQSGAMATVLHAALRPRDVAVSYAISTGNEAVNGIEDFVDYLIDRDATDVITMIVDQIRDPQRFLALAARARAAGKPIVMLHPGRSVAARAFGADSYRRHDRRPRHDAGAGGPCGRRAGRYARGVARPERADDPLAGAAARRRRRHLRFRRVQGAGARLLRGGRAGAAAALPRDRRRAGRAGARTDPADQPARHHRAAAGRSATLLQGDAADARRRRLREPGARHHHEQRGREPAQGAADPRRFAGVETCQAGDVRHAGRGRRGGARRHFRLPRPRRALFPLA